MVEVKEEALRKKDLIESLRASQAEKEEEIQSYLSQIQALSE